MKKEQRHIKFSDDISNKESNEMQNDSMGKISEETSRNDYEEKLKNYRSQDSQKINNHYSKQGSTRNILASGASASGGASNQVTSSFKGSNSKKQIKDKSAISFKSDVMLNRLDKSQSHMLDIHRTSVKHSNIFPNRRNSSGIDLYTINGLEPYMTQDEEAKKVKIDDTEKIQKAIDMNQTLQNSCFNMEELEKSQKEIRMKDPEQHEKFQNCVEEYLKEYHQRQSTKKKYTDKDVATYRSIKDVLNTRSQFNKRKQAVHEQLEKKFVKKKNVDQKGTENLAIRKQPQNPNRINKVANQSNINEINAQQPHSYLDQAYQDKTNAHGVYDPTMMNENQLNQQRYNKKKKQPFIPQYKFDNSGSYRQRYLSYKELVTALKDEYTFLVHGKKVKYSKTSFGMLTNKSMVRIAFVWVATWQWYEYFILAMILFNSLLLGIKDYTDKDNTSERNKFVDSFEPFFMYTFTLEAIIKIVAFGFMMGKNSYLSVGWNWLDFIVVVTSLLNEIPSMRSMSVLRTFRLFRPLRTLTTLPSMRILVGTLMSSVVALGGILGLALFFFLIFAILGISLWSGSINYRCRQTPWPVDGDWLPVPGDLQLCSKVRPCEVGYCGSLIEAYDQFQNITVENLYRDSQIPELNYGLTNFDNIFMAFLTIFQCITMEGWTTIMYIYMDAYQRWFVTLYFLACVICCSFFLLNLTIAFMLHEYEELDKNEANSEHRSILRELGHQAKLPNILTQFIIEQDNIGISKKVKKLLNKKSEMSLWQRILATEKHPDGAYYRSKITQFFYKVTMSNLFGSFIMLVIILNTGVLAMDRYPAPSEEESYVLNVINYTFTTIFTLEVIIKMVGMQPKQYMKDRYNIFDLVIVIMSLIEVFFSSDNSSTFGALRAVRLFRVFKLFKAGDLRILMDSIAFTVTTIGNYGVLLALFIYVCALIGMSFFAGVMRFNDEDQPDLQGENLPRANFDTLLWSSISIFQILIGDNWNTIMYDAIRSTNILASAFFIMLFMCGNIIMLNLFLAILLGNFDKSRNFGAKKKVFETFKALNEEGYDLSQQVDLVLGDLSYYVKTKVLKWPENIIKRQEETQNKDQFERVMMIKRADFLDSEISKEDLDEIPSPQKSMQKRVSIKEVPPIRKLSTQEMDKRSNSALKKSPSIRKSMTKIDQSKNRAVSEMDFSMTSPTNSVQKPKIEKKLSFASKDIYMEDSQRINLIEVEFNDQESIQDQVLVGGPNDPLSIRTDKISTNQEDNSSQLDQRKQFAALFGNKDLLVQRNFKCHNKLINFTRKQRLQDEKELQELKKRLPNKLSRAKTFGTTTISRVQPDELSESSYFTQDENLTCCQRILSYMQNSSLFIFHKDGAIRKLCLKLVYDSNSKASSKSDQSKISQATSIYIKGKQKKKKGYCANTPPSKIFDNFILFLILSSSIMLVIDTPLSDPQSSLMQLMAFIDYIYTFLFLIELIIKVIALGFFHNNFQNKELDPYIHSAWNILDFFVVISSVIDFFVTNVIGGESNDALSSLKSLRALRALRPLRTISRFEGMKLVVNALLASIPAMTNVLLVCALLLLIFAIMGVNFFKGQFYHCEGLTNDQLEQVITKQDCLDLGGLWKNNQQNFDNTYQAFMSLFIMMTTEGWLGVAYYGIDATGIDMQPKQDTGTFRILYFIAYMIVGSVFILNLFVGVVIDNFNKIKEREEMGNVYVTDAQRDWIEVQKLCLSKNLQIKLPDPKGCQKVFTNIVEHKTFEGAIMLCIILNTIVMSLKYDRMSEKMINILEQSNYFFAAVFNLEMFLKLFAYGKRYFRDSWRNFDALVVILTDFGLLINILDFGENVSSAASVVRGFRIMRIFRLIRSSMSIRLILDALVHIIPQITNIVSLIFLLFFIYSALGINLFGAVMLQDQLNSKNNFQSFGSAMLLLMRCSTGEDWQLIMFELANQDGYNGVACKNEQTYEEMMEEGILGCGTNFSYFYFFSFTILISMLILNLSVAAVIEGLATARKENCGLVESEQIDKLIDIWKDYDPNGTGWITITDLIFVICELDPPLGTKRQEKNGNQDQEKVENGEVRGNNNMQDRFLVNLNKKIIIKKVEALALLNDIHVKTYKNGEHQIHFKDVFKALIKRIMVKRKMDYKLSTTQLEKMRKLWNKKFKDLAKEKSSYSVSEQQAGAIITKWVRKNKYNINKSKKKDASSLVANAVSARDSKIAKESFNIILAKLARERGKSTHIKDYSEKEGDQKSQDEAYHWMQRKGNRKFRAMLKKPHQQNPKILAMPQMTPTNIRSNTITVNENASSPYAHNLAALPNPENEMEIRQNERTQTPSDGSNLIISNNLGSLERANENFYADFKKKDNETIDEDELNI